MEEALHYSSIFIQLFKTATIRIDSDEIIVLSMVLTTMEPYLSHHIHHTVHPQPFDNYPG